MKIWNEADNMSEYKNILWIEDCDTNDKTGMKGTDWLDNENKNEDEDENEKKFASLKNEYFGQLSTGVKLVPKYREALEELQENCYNYDLIVFDLDFKDEDFGEYVSFNEILELLKNGHVTPNSNDEFTKVAGYYLYLYLIMKGFPTNRMVILTANSQNYQSSDNNISLQIDRDIIEKNHDSEWIKPYYSKTTSHYYRIQRMVHHACCHWINKLNDINKHNDKNLIPFNKLYSLNIPPKTFIETLEHIKMLFPVVKPNVPEMTYYKAMQTIAAFHEENAKIQKLKQPKLKRYHSCIRNFRNWSAHNHMPSKLTDEKFACLFCIALRTYLVWNSDESLKNSKLLEYEKIYEFDSNSDINDDINDERLENSLLNIWKNVNEKLNNRYYFDLEETIRELGKKEGHNMSDYLFLPIWCPQKLFTTINVQLKSGQVEILINREGIAELCKNAKSKNNNSADISFMRYCYHYINGEFNNNNN